MAFITRFTTTTNGAMTFTGNTLGLSKEINVNGPGTSDAIGTFITIDTTKQDGPLWFPGTTPNWQENSSSALLTIPAGSTVLYAELVWGGSYNYGGQNVSAFLNNSVSLTTPAATSSVSPDAATATTLTTPSFFYMRSANVTALLQTGGAGTYTVGAVPGTEGASENTSNHAGWTLAVIYSKPTLPTRNMTLFVGGDFIASGGSPVDTTISGFTTPPSGTLNGRILVSAQEGDANRTGDQLLFGPTVGTLGNLSGPNNPANNFFVSQINNDSGTLDTSGTFGTRNQNAITATNISGGRQGWDITNVSGSSLLINSQTSAVVRLTTNGDTYMANALGIQVDINAPNIQMVKTVDKLITTLGDTLTYTVTLTNSGLVATNNFIFTDPIPAGTSYIIDTFTVDSSTITGLTPPFNYNIGSIPAGGSITVQFMVQVDFLPVPADFDNVASGNYQFQYPPGGTTFNGNAISNTTQTMGVKVALQALKSVNRTEAVIGNTLNYTILLTNSGEVDLNNVVLNDPLPNCTTFVPNSLYIGGSQQLGAVPPFNFNLGTIIAGGSRTITFQVTTSCIPPSQQYTNLAFFNYNYQVGGTTFIGNTPSNSVITQAKEVNVTMTKSVDQTTAILGDILTYTVILQNRGTLDVSSINFSDSIPNCTQFVPNSFYIGATQIPGITPPFNYNIGNITAGGSKTVSFQVQLICIPAIPQYINQASSSFTYVLNGATFTGTANSNSVITITQLNPLLTIVKTVDTAAAIVGDILNYTVTINNPQTYAMLNVIFTDSIPAGTTFVPNSLYVNSAQQAGVNPPFNFNTGTLASLGTTTVTFQVTVDFIPSPPQFDNQSMINFTTSLDPSTTFSQPSTIATTIGETISLQTIKSANKVAVLPGDTVTYSVTITNTGTVNADNVRFNDPLPAGATFVPNSFYVGTTQVLGATPPFNYNLGTLLANGGNQTVTFQVIVDSNNPPSELTNQASLLFDYTLGGTTVINNPAQSNLSLIPIEKVIVDAQKSVDAAEAIVGNVLTYTVVVKNTGTLPLANVIFHDPLPECTTFVADSLSVGGGQITGAIPPFDFNLGTLTAGQSKTITFQVTVECIPQSNQYLNRASFDFEYTLGGTTYSDSTLSNHALTQAQSIDLQVNKSVNPLTAVVGDILTYAIVIENKGTLALSNFIFSDPIAPCTSFVPNSLYIDTTQQPGINPPFNVNLGTVAVAEIINITFQVEVTCAPLSLQYIDQAFTTYEYPLNGTTHPGSSPSNTVITTYINQPPTVQILSPPNNSTVSGIVPLLIAAQDDLCLAKVDVYIDGVLVYTETLGSVTTDEFVFNWDTNEFSEGPHTVRAVATDCAGLTAATTNTYIVDNLPDHFQQVLLACDNLTIPPQKPDVEFILDCSVTPIVKHINIFNTIDGTKITVTGIVEVGITYSAIDPYDPYNPYNTQEEHFAHFNVPFHAMIIYPGLPLDAKIVPVIVIEHQDCLLIDPRTIKENIVLFVGIKQCT